MLPVDKDIRDAILSIDGNVVISASAGTGKTYTTIQRILKDSEGSKNYQTFAAITFTRKAAKEISNRLGPRKGDGFVGTNDNFILLEIVQPFMYDAYGLEFKVEIIPDFNDENKIDTFEEGLEKIKKTNFMCKYSDKKKNFPFQLALSIIRRSLACRRYLKAKYHRIYIDEYQDSDKDMHDFFMYLCDELKIPLFIVGDSKQSIYSWRGAYSDGFISLFSKSNFNKYELYHNFRSNIVIQNYSNIFMKEVRKYYQSTNFNDEIIALKYRNEVEVSEYIKSWINPEEKCAFLNFRNLDAEGWSEQLQSVGTEFVFIPGSPLDSSELESEHVWIARAVANYLVKDRFSEYDFYDEIPMPEAYSIREIRKLLADIRESRVNKEYFNRNAFNLYSYIGYIDITNKIKKEVEKLFEVINDDRYIPTYNQDKYKLISGTIHSSKGLEFKQVIINVEDFNFRFDDTNFLHYVAISRPEERLLIIGKDRFMERYRAHLEKVISETQELGIDIEINNVIKFEEIEMVSL